jgi:hypothetical protein
MVNYLRTRRRILAVLTVASFNLSCSSASHEVMPAAPQTKLTSYSRERLPAGPFPEQALTIRQVTQCKTAIDLYNSLDDVTPVENLYANLADDVTSWRLVNHAPDRFYSLEPQSLIKLSLTLEIATEQGGQQSSLECLVPELWHMQIWQDATVSFPQSMRSYSEPALTNPDQIGLATLGGIGFQYLDSIGHEVYFGWTLRPDQQVTTRVWDDVQRQIPLLSRERVEVVIKPLVDATVVDPLEIISFSGPNEPYHFDRLMVKDPSTFDGSLPLSPYYELVKSELDYALTDPFASMQKNGSESLVALRALTYPDLKPLPCSLTAPITSMQNCYNVNKRYIYSKFEPTLTGGLSSTPPQETCVLAYYKTTLDRHPGLVKLICIDSTGQHRLAFNEFHPYIDEAIEAIQMQTEY